jgi:hypothetical protein
MLGVRSLDSALQTRRDRLYLNQLGITDSVLFNGSDLLDDEHRCRWQL